MSARLRGRRSQSRRVESSVTARWSCSIGTAHRRPAAGWASSGPPRTAAPRRASSRPARRSALESRSAVRARFRSATASAGSRPGDGDRVARLAARRTDRPRGGTRRRPRRRAARAEIPRGSSVSGSPDRGRLRGVRRHLRPSPAGSQRRTSAAMATSTADATTRAATATQPHPTAEAMSGGAAAPRPGGSRPRTSARSRRRDSPQPPPHEARRARTDEASPLAPWCCGEELGAVDEHALAGDVGEEILVLRSRVERDHTRSSIRVRAGWSPSSSVRAELSNPELSRSLRRNRRATVCLRSTTARASARPVEMRVPPGR